VHEVDPTSRPIGVFDSGIGGLTVLSALQGALPDEQFIYLGDTARLPYGTKSTETIERYALQVAELLVARGVKALIVACNTASAAALPALRARHASLPVMGVVEPGAAAAAAATRNGRIAVIGTEATVRGGAYQRAIAERTPTATVHTVACQLLVALAEEGWTEGVVARETAARYLMPLFGARRAVRPDTLVLGCTHFPMLRTVIGETVGPQVEIVDSAATAAHATHETLAGRGLLRVASQDQRGRAWLLATDGAQRFATVGSRFLGRTIAVSDVELVDIR
jgi:glutamate racemase